jgi:formamidopyrimidine-DNA glycosylase
VTKAEAPDLYLVINPKLTGRPQLCEPKAKKAGPVHAVLHLRSGQDLRYVYQKKMGQVFLIEEALAISREEFKARLRPFRCEIKGVLMRGDFVAGVGNTVAGEGLWATRIHPYRKRTSPTTNT